MELQIPFHEALIIFWILCFSSYNYCRWVNTTYGSGNVKYATIRPWNLSFLCDISWICRNWKSYRSHKCIHPKTYWLLLQSFFGVWLATVLRLLTVCSSGRHTSKWNHVNFVLWYCHESIHSLQSFTGDSNNNAANNEDFIFCLWINGFRLLGHWHFQVIVDAILLEQDSCNQNNLDIAPLS